MTTSTDSLRPMREWIEALSQRDRARCRAAWYEDAVWMNRASGQTWRGPDEITSQLWNWREACPDLHIEIADDSSSGSRGFVEAIWAGKQSRPFATPRGVVAPTGKRLAWTTGYLFDTRAGQVSAITEYFDASGLLPYPFTFPSVAYVEVREHGPLPGAAQATTKRRFFPAIAVIDLTSAFPELAPIAWDERDDAAVEVRPRSVPTPTSFPNLARHPW